MDLFTLEFEPPKDVTTDRFVIFQTDEGLFESDHAAVMKSRDYLRVWSQSSWPEDDFSPEQNREDLKQHVDDNRTHTAYGYMIYSPDRKTCYGSLYVNPSKPIMTNYITTVVQRDELEKYDARIDCWIAPDVETGFEADILKSIREWLENEWKIRPLFSARPGMERRETIYQQIGLKIFADLQSATSNMRLRVFN